MGTPYGKTWHEIRKSQTIILDGHKYEVSPQQKIILAKLRDAPPGHSVSVAEISLALWGDLAGPEDERGTIGVVLADCRRIVGRTAIINVFAEGWYLATENLKHNVEARVIAEN